MSLFEVQTPLGFRVRTTNEYWEKVITKHPDIENRLQDVMNTLTSPDEIRRSRHDELVFLFYTSSEHRWLSVVVNGLMILEF